LNNEGFLINGKLIRPCVAAVAKSTVMLQHLFLPCSTFFSVSSYHCMQEKIRQINALVMSSFLKMLSELYAAFCLVFMDSGQELLKGFGS
jgi:hypothetical protein